MNLFDVNGPVMNALRKLSCIFLCNVMFCLFCLPIVTAGASLTALYTCMLAVINDDEEDVILRQFWDAFRSNFGKSTILWLFTLLAVGFLAAFYRITSVFTGIMGVSYRVLFFILSILFLMGFQYFFPMQAHYENKVRNTIRNSWLMSIAALPWTLLTIAVSAGAIYITFFMNPAGFQTAVFLWGTVGFGIVSYLNSFFFQKAFSLIDPEKKKFSAKPAEGAIFIDEEHRDRTLPEQSAGLSNPYWNQRSFDYVSKKPEEK